MRVDIIRGIVCWRVGLFAGSCPLFAGSGECLRGFGALSVGRGSGESGTVIAVTIPPTPGERQPKRW
jgi:hypothetical protein